MKADDIRMTVRLPRDAAAYLDAEAGQNFTSRNAEIVRAIREAMKTNGPASAATLPGLMSSTPNSEFENDERA